MNQTDLVGKFLEFKVVHEGRSEGTAAKYRGYLVRLFDFLAAEGVDPLEADRELLEEFVGLHSHNLGLTPRSRRAVVAAVKGFYAWCSELQLVARDPACRLRYPEYGAPLPDAATLSTAEKLLMAPDLSDFTGVRDAALLAVLIGGGVRVSGLVGLNESSLMFTQSENESERLTIKVMEKGRKERLVPLPLEAQLLIRAYLGHPDLDSIDRELENGDRVLFVSTRNHMIPAHEYRGEHRRLSPRAIQHMLRKYGRQQGLPEKETKPHALRHLFGTELSEGDESLLVSQALLGHSDPRTTEIYTRLASRKLQQAIDRSSPFNRINSPVRDMARLLREKN